MLLNYSIAWARPITSTHVFLFYKMRNRAVRKYKYRKLYLKLNYVVWYLLYLLLIYCIMLHKISKASKIRSHSCKLVYISVYVELVSELSEKVFPKILIITLSGTVWVIFSPLFQFTWTLRQWTRGDLRRIVVVGVERKEYIQGDILKAELKVLGDLLNI